MQDFSKLVYLKKLHGVDMKPSTYRVLVTLFDYTNEKGKNAHPGVDNLSRDTRLSKSQVKRCIAELKSAGWICETKAGGRSGDGTAWATVYELADSNEADRPHLISTAHPRPHDDSHGLKSASSWAHSDPLMGSSDASHGLTHEPPSDLESDFKSDHASEDQWGHAPAWR